MSTIRVTVADLIAYRLLTGRGGDNREGPEHILEAGNRIIALAESIKAQRLASAMQSKDEFTDTGERTTTSRRALRREAQ